MDICEHILKWIWPLAFLVAILISGSIAYYWAKGRFISQEKSESLFDGMFMLFLRLTVASAVAYGVILLMLFILNSSIPSVSSMGAVGDFVGGVIGTLVTCMGAVYIVKTYIRQQEQTALQTFEKNCTTMLDFHKENVKVIEYKKGDDTLKGRNAFPEYVGVLKAIFSEVEKAIATIVNADEEMYARWKDKNEQMKLAHELSYGYFFYSVEDYILDTKEDDTMKYLCEAVRTEVDKNMTENKTVQAHIQLGHYYRHLYNMIKYIDEVEHIGSKHKENYSQIIRALLSDYEQVLLYYNSMSQLGKPWNQSLGIEDKEKMCFMAKYRLLKNCPKAISFFGIFPKDTYKVEIAEYSKEGERFFDYI